MKISPKKNTSISGLLQLWNPCIPYLPLGMFQKSWSLTTTEETKTFSQESDFLKQTSPPFKGRHSHPQDLGVLQVPTNGVIHPTWNPNPPNPPGFWKFAKDHCQPSSVHIYPGGTSGAGHTRPGFGGWNCHVRRVHVTGVGWWRLVSVENLTRKTDGKKWVLKQVSGFAYGFWCSQATTFGFTDVHLIIHIDIVAGTLSWIPTTTPALTFQLHVGKAMWTLGRLGLSCFLWETTTTWFTAKAAKNSRTYIEDMPFDSWADPHPGLITQTILTEKEGEVARNRMPDENRCPFFRRFLKKHVLPLGPSGSWVDDHVWICFKFRLQAYQAYHDPCYLDTFRLPWLTSILHSLHLPIFMEEPRSNLPCIPKTFIPKKTQKNTPPKCL